MLRDSSRGISPRIAHLGRGRYRPTIVWETPRVSLLLVELSSEVSPELDPPHGLRVRCSVVDEVKFQAIRSRGMKSAGNSWRDFLALNLIQICLRCKVC
jgi:hypothetical protein